MPKVKPRKKKAPAVKVARKSRKPSVTRRASLKRAVKKARRTTPSPKRRRAQKPPQGNAAKVLGEVTHYFPRIRVAVVNLVSPAAIGDRIKITGHTTDFTQDIASMQIDHVALEKAQKGDIIGLRVKSRVRRHDVVRKI